MAKKTPSVRLTVSVSPEINERLEKEAVRLATTKNAVVVAWISDRIRSLDSMTVTKDDILDRILKPEVLNELFPQFVELMEKQGIQTTLDLGKEKET